MIYVPYDTPEDDAWKKWHEDAIERAKALVRDFRFGIKPLIDNTFYKRPRQYLLDRFHEKCAYCETKIDRCPVDVEHYRPKGKVSDAKRAIVKVLYDKEEYDHPGYYWLAYEWSNLIPSCIDCNRKRYHEEQNAEWGKETCFPVKGNYVYSPLADLDSEEPVLIHPRFDDPDNHLEFVYHHDSERRFCAIKSKTDRGEETIRILGLYDEKLAAPRLAAFERGYHRMKSLYDAYGDLFKYAPPDHGPIRKRIREIIHEINAEWNGAGSYTAFARKGMQRYIDLHRLNISLPLPVD